MIPWDIITLVDHSPLAVWMRATGWVWPALEIMHLYGMILLVGGVLIFDLRVLGFTPTLPLGPATGLLKLAMLGCGMNLITGSLLVLGDLNYFLKNPALWLKLSLIVAAGLNALFFTIYIHRGAASRIMGLGARISAALSLVFWGGVIALARFISYTESIP